jgi:signal transduction histidine kinase
MQRNHTIPDGTGFPVATQVRGVLFLQSGMFFCIFTIMLTGGVRGQDPQSLRTRIDSLEAVLQQMSVQDTGRARATRSLANALNRAAEQRLRSHRTDGVEELLARSLRLREQVRDSVGIGYSLYWQGWLEEERGDRRQAMTQYERCLSLRLAIGDTLGASHALRAIGILHAATGGYEDAVACFTRCVTLAAAAGNLDAEATAHNNLGSILTNLGRHDEALTHLSQAMALQERMGQTEGDANILTNIGNIHLARQQYDKALTYYHRAVALRERHADSVGLAKALNNIGTVHLKLGSHDTALAYYQRTLAIREAVGDRRGVSNVLNNIGLIYKSRGDHEAALDCFRRSLAVMTERNDRSGMAASHINAGNALRELGRHTEAMEAYNAGLLLAREIGELQWQQNALAGLGDLHAQRGDFWQAWLYQRQYQIVHDSLLSEVNVRSINELAAKYESERQSHRIGTLEHEREMQGVELELQRQRSAVKDLELARAAEQIEVQTLLAERTRQRAQLIARRSEIQRLQLQHRGTELSLIRTQLVTEQQERTLRQKELTIVTRERAYHASAAQAAERERNILLLSLGLLLVIGYLAIARIRGRRIEAALRAEAAEAREMEARITLAHRERDMQRQFTTLLIENGEQERRRLARELHDGIGQELLVIANQAELGLMNGAAPAAGETLRRIGDLSQKVIEDLRRVSRDLRPVQLERAGFTETLRDVLEQVASATPLRVQAEIEDIDGLLPGSKEIHLFRIVQEAVTNILRHAQASTATVHVAREDACISIRISDDGRGFDVASVSSRRSAGAGLGLQGMRERVHMLEGEIRIRSGARGTVVDVQVPLQTREAMTDEGRAIP